MFAKKVLVFQFWKWGDNWGFISCLPRKKDRRYSFWEKLWSKVLKIRLFWYRMWVFFKQIRVLMWDCKFRYIWNYATVGRSAFTKFVFSPFAWFCLGWKYITSRAKRLTNRMIYCILFTKKVLVFQFRKWGDNWGFISCLRRKKDRR